MARALLLTALAAAALVAPAAGHGFLAVPPSRNYYENTQQRFWNHMSGNGAGPCGDPFQGMTTNFVASPSPIQATYAAGGTVTLGVVLTSNHGGRFYYRVCPRTAPLDEACFGTNYLTRVDNGQRDTWLMSDAANWTAAYRLPAGLSCDAGCVLQWRYEAMQSCIVPGCDPALCGGYASGRNVVYGSTPGFCSPTNNARLEVFSNCADVRITPASGGGGGGGGAPSDPPPPPPASPAPAPTPPPPSDADDSYARVLGQSLLFYEAQQSGALPAWNRLRYGTPGAQGQVGYRKDAHLTDGAAIGRNLAGGWYDAGDQIKCPHPMAWALANVALSGLEFRDTYVAFGEWEHLVSTVSWAADWLARAHVAASDAPAGNVFVGQVSNDADHDWFGRPEQNPTPRPVYLVNSTTGGADVAGEYAAAFAAAAGVLRAAGNETGAAALFKRAEQAFGFAVEPAHRKNYVIPGIRMAYSTYASNGWLAHVAWAAALMCRHSPAYCPTAETWWGTASASSLQYSFGFDWDSALPGAAAVLAAVPGLGVSSAARTWLEGFVLAKWQNTASRCPASPYSTVCYTPKGLAWYSEWGTLRNTANAVWLAVLLAKSSAPASKATHACWARRQMRYMLGSSGSDRSYVIGYGPNWPQRPHHRQSACAATYTPPCALRNGGTCCAGESGTGPGGCCDQPNFMSSNPAQITLLGGLVGGPDQSDVYPDIRNDYKQSEVAVDYNAGLTGAAAGLAAMLAAGDLAACGAGPGGPTPPPPPAASPSPPPPAASPGPAPPAASPAPPGTCAVTIAPWSNPLTGSAAEPRRPGQRVPPAAGTCSDAAWPNHCCTSGNVCVKENPWWWACKPGTAAPPASPTPAPPATPSPAPVPRPSPSPAPVPPSPSPRPVVTPPPPGTCVASVGPWGRCGGRVDACPTNVPTCTDSQWPGYCCGDGYECKRDSQWWWMCAPKPVSPPPPAPPACANAVANWAQCGGRSSKCPPAAGTCTDTPWANHCCASGSACLRDGEWWWACKPAPATTSAQSSLLLAALAEGAGGDSLTAASSARAELERERLDLLVFTAAPRRVRAGARVRLALALSRQGAPVGGAGVYVTITTSGGGADAATATLGPFTTSADGSLRVTVPPRLRGVAGARSVVQAYTGDARAQGAKGGVAVMSGSARIAWT
ncbi:celF [Scenedesmus sp. PABB004]|nr:celF [Scenedesmus sp. PABB004]